jgi:hypothetical protein
VGVRGGVQGTWTRHGAFQRDENDGVSAHHMPSACTKGPRLSCCCFALPWRRLRGWPGRGIWRWHRRGVGRRGGRRGGRRRRWRAVAGYGAQLSACFLCYLIAICILHVHYCCLPCLAGYVVVWQGSLLAVCPCLQHDALAQVHLHSALEAGHAMEYKLLWGARAC